jgi:hypothetical protein
MKRSKTKDLDVRKSKTDIRPLDQREHPLITRKGMPKGKPKGFFDKTDYAEQLLFDETLL